METIHTHQSSRKKKNTTKTNVVIAIVVPVLMVAAGAFWAAHKGILGAKLQNLAVFMVPKEKKADEPKKIEKAEVKKVEQPKTLEAAKAAVAPPPRFVAPGGSTIAPPAPVGISIPSFGDGDDSSATGSGDLIALYKQQIETMLRTYWDRPADVQDLTFMA